MTTPTTPDSRSRWVTPASYAVLGALGATILAACAPSTGLDMTKPMSDGTWTAQSNADDQGSIGTITITGKGGRTDTLPAHQLILQQASHYPRRGLWFPSPKDPAVPLRATTGSPPPSPRPRH